MKFTFFVIQQFTNTQTYQIRNTRTHTHVNIFGAKKFGRIRRLGYVANQSGSKYGSLYNSSFASVQTQRIGLKVYLLHKTTMYKSTKWFKLRINKSNFGL